MCQWLAQEGYPFILEDDSYKRSMKFRIGKDYLCKQKLMELNAYLSCENDQSYNFYVADNN